MASLLPDLRDYVRQLMEGLTTNVDRTIPTGRFEHTEYDIETLLPNTVSKPYPFNIRFAGWDPVDGRPNVSGNYRYLQNEMIVRVAYASDPNEGYTRDETIADDFYSLHRTLTDPESWDGQAGFEGCQLLSGEITEGSPVFGENEEPTGFLDILEVRLQLTYREDHST